MTARFRCFFLLCALSFLVALPAHAKRIALVIGNDNYLQVTRLEKAGNDADAMARELSGAGFEVKKHRDLTFKQMVVAFEVFFDQIKGGDDVLVFYAGHGVQTDRGSFLLPTDIEGETQSQIEKMSYSVNGLLEELDRIKARFSLLIVDACRDNPLRSRGRSIGISRGLNAPDLAKGQMVIFSAGKNQKALDSLNNEDASPNGVFTREFIPRMRRPGLSVEAMALEVKNSVERLARTVNHDQRPLIVNDSTGDFYFFNPAAAAGSTPNPGASAPNEAAREDYFWQDSKAPDNLEGYEAYLSLYPSGRYAGLARANMSRIKGRVAIQPATTAAAPATVTAAPAPVTAASVQVAALARPASPQAIPAAPAATTPVPAADTAPAQSLPDVMAPAPPPTAPGRTFARYTLANGDKYEGETVGALRTGRGKYQFANGDRYEGDLQDNVYTGKGVLTFAYGDRYEGDFVRGIKHGQGVYVFANKDRYEGGFVDNLYAGKGVLTYANGERYAGDFQRGAKQGQGVYTFANGDRFEGSFVNNLFNGKGTLVLATRDRYEGEFRDSAKEGTGVHFFASGDRYEGSFRAGAQSGAGTHFYLNGDRYVGLFEAGVRHGKGVYHFVNGQQKALEFVQGVEKSP